MTLLVGARSIQPGTGRESPLPIGPSLRQTRKGGLMLYGSTTLVVVFYLTFDSSCSDTPLGRADDPQNRQPCRGRANTRSIETVVFTAQVQP
jgi:hypothetical protein